MVQNNILPEISKAVDSSVKALNDKLANESAYTFVVPLMKGSLPLNLTMTTAPDFAQPGIINLQFDGKFVMPEGQEKNFTYAAVPPTSRVAHGLSEQFCFHESMLNSLINVYTAQNLPMTIDNANFTAIMMKAFPELPLAYGAGATYTFTVDL